MTTTTTKRPLDLEEELRDVWIGISQVHNEVNIINCKLWALERKVAEQQKQQQEGSK
jgi:hypothetical protein